MVDNQLQHIIKTIYKVHRKQKFSGGEIKPQKPMNITILAQIDTVAHNRDS